MPKHTKADKALLKQGTLGGDEVKRIHSEAVERHGKAEKGNAGDNGK